MPFFQQLGDAISATDPNGDMTASSYDLNRRVTSLTLPATASGALVTANSYDPDGRVTGTQQSVNGTGLRSTANTYTLTGKLSSVTDPNGNVTAYAYDGDDRLSSVTDPLNRVTVNGYDSLSRLQTVSNAAVQANPLVTKTYSPNGHLASLQIARSNSVADTTGFSYDGLDRLSVTTWPDSSTEALSYDADSNVAKRLTRAGDSISFAYDGLNRICTKTYAASAVACGGTSANYLVNYAYDLDGRLMAANDNATSVQAVTVSASYAETLSYDARNESINTSWSPAPTQSTPSATSVTFNHAYDGTNRRVNQTTTDSSWWSEPSSAGSVSYTANNLNQYSAVGAVTPTYDGNGNLTYDGSYTYCYDTESRLIGVLSAGTCASPTTTVATYAYDAQGRRKAKTVGGITTIFVTDADNREVLEYNGSGATQNWYAYGQGSNEVLNQMNVSAGTRATLIPDIQGSIIGSLASGSTLTKTGYQSFGENPSLSSGSFQYAAARFDPESDFYYMRSRMYRTDWGRFLQPDTIGYAGGNNLYAYTNNDPLNQTDPSGLCPLCVTGAAGAALGLAGSYFSDPAHFTWQRGLAGAAVGGAAGLTGVGLVDAFGLGAGAEVTASVIAGRVALSAGSNYVAGAGGSIANSVVSNQPIDWSGANTTGLIAGGAGLLSGETAAAALVKGLSPTANAALGAYLSTTSSAISIPVESAVTNGTQPSSGTGNSGYVSDLQTVHLK